MTLAAQQVRICHILKNEFLKFRKSNVITSKFRYLNYTSKEYEQCNSPSLLFLNKEVQSHLRILTRMDLNFVYRRRKLGQKMLTQPTYKFMTDEELQQEIQQATNKAEEYLQMPPVMPVRVDTEKILGQEPALQGLETCRMVFTDITFGNRDTDRLIIVREPDGTLKEANLDVRNRMNQLYFPKKHQEIKVPQMFQNDYLKILLSKKEYEFVLDRACVQFEPYDKEYQRVTSITYQYVNDSSDFKYLRSTRHFGPLVFFLCWNKCIDNLLLELIETSNIKEANVLLLLYEKIHNLKISHSEQNKLETLEKYIKEYSNKRSPLELALQAYKELELEKNELENSLKSAHGLI